MGRVIGAGHRLSIGSGAFLINVEQLRIGSNVYLGPGVWINALGGLDIGDEVIIGPYVCIATTEHGFFRGSARYGGTHLGSVALGRGSWIGSHATVMPGVNVGAGTVVAANAAVTRTTPSDVVVGGVPAKVMKPRVDNPGGIERRSDV